ncbi:MAG TPA: hypothetical protein VMG12_07770 [Polyangiaceae bacterium]|nr:hypothetical protein [Polyangiaceae bacterium]
MPAEPPPERSDEKAPTGNAAPAPARAPRPSAAQSAEAERRLNSPTPLTLRLLGVVFAATMLPWVAAKAACNLRDSPVRQPHDLPTETLAKNAKSAALELSQRAASGRYREAAELAKGDVAAELLAADERCKTEPAPCKKRLEQSEHVFTRAVVASRGPFEASVRTESRIGDEPPERFAMHLNQEDGRWYVTKRAALEGPVDAPVAPDEMVSPIAVRPAPDMSIAPGAGPLLPTPPHGLSPHDLPPPGLAPHGLAPHVASPHGSAPSNGAPSGTGNPSPAPTP